MCGWKGRGLGGGRLREMTTGGVSRWGLRSNHQRGGSTPGKEVAFGRPRNRAFLRLQETEEDCDGALGNLTGESSPSASVLSPSSGGFHVPMGLRLVQPHPVTCSLKSSRLRTPVIRGWCMGWGAGPSYTAGPRAYSADSGFLFFFFHFF